MPVLGSYNINKFPLFLKRKIHAALRRLTHVVDLKGNVVPVTIKLLHQKIHGCIIVEYETNNGEKFGSYIKYDTISLDGVGSYNKYETVSLDGGHSIRSGFE
jgi:hypothetical protein